MKKALRNLLLIALILLLPFAFFTDTNAKTKPTSSLALSNSRIISIIKAGEGQFSSVLRSGDNKKTVIEGSNIWGKLPAKYSTVPKLKTFYSKYWSESMIESYLMKCVKPIGNQLYIRLGEPPSINWNTLKVTNKKIDGRTIHVIVSVQIEDHIEKYPYDLTYTKGKWIIDHSGWLSSSKVLGITLKK